jgi:Fe-S cluster biogenesis protein NfuA
MHQINIRETGNPAILKFEFQDFIVPSGSYEFGNIDQAKDSPLAQQLFYLPFVKTVYLSGNFVAIERYGIVEWDDVKDEVAQQLDEYISAGKPVLLNSASPKKQALSIYAEMTPNPSAMKFVASVMLAKHAAEFRNIDETASSPLALALFNFPYVKEVFIDENYVSITKYDRFGWDELVPELRAFIKQFIENGGKALDDSHVEAIAKKDKQKIAHFDDLDTTSQRIVNILDEYVKPAVQADGGNILFDSYDPADKRVKVVLQGACNGCPSSTFTLKSGIENMLKDMLHDEEIKVEALNN